MKTILILLILAIPRTAFAPPIKHGEDAMIKYLMIMNKHGKVNFIREEGWRYFLAMSKPCVTTISI